MLNTINQQDLLLLANINIARTQLDKYKTDIVSVEHFLSHIESAISQYHKTNNISTLEETTDELLTDLIQEIENEAISQFQFYVELDQLFEGSFESYLKEPYNEALEIAKLAFKNFQKLIN